MLVTDSALQDMEREANSLIGRLSRMLGRPRSRPAAPAPAVRALPHVSGPSGDDERAVGTKFLAAITTLVPELPAEDRSACVPTDPPGHLDAPTPAASFKWRRHPQLRNRSREFDDLPPEERHKGARAAATRGLFLARSERLGEARAAFAQAAADTSIDLTELPGFWRLSRGAMLVAAVAYEDVERYRDAAALSALIRTRYRPRALAPAVSQSGRQATGGGS